MVFDTGPLGCPHSSGHGHADLLSVHCAAFGEPLVVDAGTGAYQPPEVRDYFRSTSAHSTIVVDGRSQATPFGPFGWNERPRAQLRRWLSTATHDVAEADHDGYRTLPDPVIHRRRIVFVKPNYWLILDDLDGEARHDVALNFQFGHRTLVLADGAWIHAIGPSGHALAIRAWSTGRLTPAITAGSADPMGGWVSPEYGRRVPAPALTYTITERLPLRIVSAVVPQHHPAAPLPSMSELLSCVALLES
jgi:hypothetical protein